MSYNFGLKSYLWLQITHMISAQTALHSVQLSVWINTSAVINQIVMSSAMSLFQQRAFVKLLFTKWRFFILPLKMFQWSSISALCIILGGCQGWSLKVVLKNPCSNLKGFPEKIIWRGLWGSLKELLYDFTEKVQWDLYKELLKFWQISSKCPSSTITIKVCVQLQDSRVSELKYQ